jgi:hypothetical protein
MNPETIPPARAGFVTRHHGVAGLQTRQEQCDEISYLELTFYECMRQNHFS